MSALDKLAHLSLVNKVTTELENHIGIGDKTLSEFVIDLASKHADARSFQKALDEVGAELSFDLVRNLLEMIQRARPRSGGAQPGGQSAGGARADPARAPPPTIPSPASPCATTRRGPRR
jgi:ATP-dependent RNA helicase DHX8/PRP22